MATDIIARGMAAGVVSQVSADKQAVSEDRNAVEAAKTEVLNVAESIPEDYSTLSANVSELKEDLDNILYDIKNIELTLSKTSGYAYWKIVSGKAEPYTVSGDYYCYYVSVNSGKTYNMKFKYYTYTQPWIVVDDDYNVIQSAITSTYNTNTLYNENITINDGGTKLLLTGHVKYTPIVSELNVKTVKDFTIEPIIITVKKDGTGDYETIRGALDSVTDANSKTKPYVIEVYEGTYNVFEDYTNEEILSAGTEHYTDTSFVGLKFTDGISLRGVGVRENIIIHGEVSTDYEQSIRNNLSTLNFQGTMSCENVTVTAKNIRYAVHDDFTNQSGAIRKVKNCNFFGSALTSGTSGQSYGMGQRPNDNAVFENCDFGVTFLWHSANLASAKNPSSIMLLNCKAIQCSLSNYNHNVVNSVYLNNCDFDSVIIGFHSGTSDTNNCKLFGVGTNSMLNSPSDYIYEINGVKRFIKPSSNVLSVGQLVSVGSALYWGGTINKTTNKDIAYGVIVGVDDKYYYVQKSGYISSDRFNLDDLSVGDYVTIDTNGLIVGGGTKENAIGVVKRIENGKGYIKLLIN